VVILVVLCLGVLSAAYYGMHRTATAVTSYHYLWRSLSWRAQLFLRKAEGDIPALSWYELWEIARTRHGFSLDTAIRDGRSIDAAIVNPYVSRDDHEAGARIFGTHCAVCHGSGGTGLRGPSLVRPGFTHGDSDLAIYKVLRDGIAGTAMVPTGLSFVERWQVVGYIRTLQERASRSFQAFHIDIDVSADQLRTPASRPDAWLTYSGSLNGWRYSPLNEITAANVSRLRMRWGRQSATNESKFESTPLVANGILFTTEPPATVIALDARSGEVIWRYDRSLPADLPICCGSVNRGLAVLGHILYFASLDGYLVAIAANNGKVIWQSQVANACGRGLRRRVWHSRVPGRLRRRHGWPEVAVSYDPRSGRAWPRDVEGSGGMANRRRADLGDREL
jgi:alcohol dehydrogenase (cytochrome c)